MPKKGISWAPNYWNSIKNETSFLMIQFKWTTL
jgi:hypothetical protein